MSFGASVMSSIIDGAVDYGFGVLQSNHQQKLQKDLINYQYGLQEDFWDKQNAYNSPSAQIARLRAAGLNPAMLNGNAINNTSGGLSSIGAPQAPSANRQSSNVSQNMRLLSAVLTDASERGFLEEQTRLFAQKVLSEQIETDIKTIARDMQMTEEEIRNMEKEALYEAYYGESILGGAPRIKDNPITAEFGERIANARKARAEAKRAELDNNERAAAQQNGVNTYQDAHDESVLRQDVLNSEKELSDAQKEYQLIINSNADSQAKANIKATLSQASANYASALYSQAQAAYTNQLKHNATEQEARNAAMHVVDLAIKNLEKSSAYSEAQINAIKAQYNRVVVGGDVHSIGELGQFIWGNLRDVISFGAYTSSNQIVK